MLDVRRYSRSELGCRLAAICVNWAFLIPKRLLRKTLRQNLRTSSIFFHWQRIGEGEGAAAGAGQTVRSGRGGASLGSSGCGAVPSPCRGGATSRASGGRGRWCGTASLRGGLARRRAFEKLAKLASSGVLARCRAPRGRRHLSWLAPRGRRRLRLPASRGQRHLRCRVPHGRPRTPPS